jgi:hypothetical protein
MVDTYERELDEFRVIKRSCPITDCSIAFIPRKASRRSAADEGYRVIGAWLKGVYPVSPGIVAD